MEDAAQRGLYEISHVLLPVIVEERRHQHPVGGARVGRLHQPRQIQQRHRQTAHGLSTQAEQEGCPTLAEIKASSNRKRSECAFNCSLLPAITSAPRAPFAPSAFEAGAGGPLSAFEAIALRSSDQSLSFAELDPEAVRVTSWLHPPPGNSSISFGNVIHSVTSNSRAPL